MARVALSEYRAKSMLLEQYAGFELHYETCAETLAGIPDGSYVLKVDQGVKKRGKQGLVAVGVSPDEALEYCRQWQQKGFDRFLLEPLFAHNQSEERYLAIDRTRNGIVLSYSDFGGIDVEEKLDAVQRYSVQNLTELQTQSGLSTAFLDRLLSLFDEQHVSFLELNPLVVRGRLCMPLDAAMLVDSAGAYFATAWTEADIVEFRKRSEAELRVRTLDENSPAALKLTVLNPNASLWLLLSGGGASIAIADTIHAAGEGDMLGNYGEYSGGPSTDETYLYTKEILQLLIQSRAPKKALIIAGGVANFTDVAKTFKGIIRALQESKAELQKQKLRVFVRRGGPNEQEGLRHMSEFLHEAGLHGSVHGSDQLLTRAAEDALAYVGGVRG